MSQVVDYTGGGGTTITGTNDVPGLDPQLIKGNVGFPYTFRKIAPWKREGGVSSTESIRNNNPSVLNYMSWGDSTGGKTFWDDTTASLYYGALYGFARSAGLLGKACNAYSTSGDYWVVDGSTHAYDYTVIPSGIYYHIGSGTGVVHWGVISAVDPGTEKFLYAIKEDDAVTTRTFTLALTNNSGTTISVNSVNATMTVDCSSAAGLTAQKCGFCYEKLVVNSGSSGTFTITFGGLTTGNIAYNASAATVQSALEALDASLVGKVGVSLSSATYTILIVCNNLAFNWKSLTADSTNLNATGYVSFTNCGTTLSTATKMICTSIAGDCRFWPAYSFDRSSHGVAYYTLTRGGLQLSNAITWDSAIATVVMSDIKADLCSFQWYTGQIGTEANLQSFITMVTADYTQTDWVVMNCPPSQSNTDAATQTINTYLKSNVEAQGWVYIDTWTALPGGWATLCALDGTTSGSWASSAITLNGFTGDGTHLGPRYNMFCGSIVSKQLGLDQWVGVKTWRPLNASGTLLGASSTDPLKFSRDAATSPVMAFYADTNDAYIKQLISNRAIHFVNSGGTVYGSLSSNSAISMSFFPVPYALGATTGPQILTHTTSPEGVKTAPVGSLCVSTGGGAGTTLYVKESGTGNTGWVAK